MIERLEFIESKFHEIETELANPEVLSDYNKMKKLSQEKSNLESIVNKYHEYTKCMDDIQELKSLVNDPEMGEMASLELESNQSKLVSLEDELKILLIPKDENDGKNIIMEIRGAAGGDEAIKGENVYSKLKYESGSHRVQRVPVTESQGRIQTSTATVAVMPEAEDLDFELDMNECRIDITRASGCGGQGVNTTDSAVRLTHLPTGIIVYSQQERSQIKNKEIAIKIMKTRLYDLKLREKEEAEGEMRRSKIGTGDRAEKIRTYNYPQNRVTDHRIGFSVMNLDRVMDGELDSIIEALIAEDQKRKLENEQN